MSSAPPPPPPGPPLPPVGVAGGINSKSPLKMQSHVSNQKSKSFDQQLKEACRGIFGEVVIYLGSKHENGLLQDGPQYVFSVKNYVFHAVWYNFCTGAAR